MPAIGAVPVPLSDIVCTPVKALSPIVTVPDSLPVLVGAYVTPMVQFDPPSRVGPQSSLSEKSRLATSFEISRGALPKLVKRTSCAGLTVPVFWLANVRVDGARVTAGTGDVTGTA